MSPAGNQYNFGDSVNATLSGDLHVGAGPGRPDPVDLRIRVLLLAANPLGSARLAIDEEARAIGERLRMSHDRDTFDLITGLAVRPMDLLQYLNQHRPHVVHFSGHGSGSGELLLASGDGAGRRVSAAAIGDLFRSANDNIRVVVLNACYSAAAVAAIGPHVDHVVGMKAAITDEAAIVFAAAFYSALGFGRSVPQAFDQAVALLAGCGHPARELAERVARPQADPYLTGGSR